MTCSVEIRKMLFVLAVSVACLAGCHQAKKQEPLTASARRNVRSTDLRDTISLTTIPRDYGWQLLATIMAPDGTWAGAQPNWQTWSTKCHISSDIHKLHSAWSMRVSPLCYDSREALFQDDGTALTSAVRSGERNPQISDASRAASVFFNSIAVQSINENGLNLPAKRTDRDFLTPVLGSPSPTAKFNSGSIIVKAIWERVGNEGGIWPLRVYDYSKPQWRVDSQSRNPPQSLAPIQGTAPGSGWATRIYLDVERTDCTHPAGQPPATIPENERVPIGCFVAHKVTPQTDATVALLGNTAGHRRFTDDYYLVLVGLNISVKDSEGWNFTALWFTNNHDADPQRTDIPAAYRKWPYTQFAMNTSKEGHSLQNPYLEGPMGNTGMASNCASCHVFAGIRIDANGKIQSSQSGLGLLERNLPANYNNPNFMTATDMVWALALARDGQGNVLASHTFDQKKILGLPIN